jgi:transcriptional regulator NrdR family protein
VSVCIKCNAWKTKVLQTRKLFDDGWTFRERKCDLCGHRWDTVEVPAEDIRTPGAPGSHEDSDD